MDNIFFGDLDGPFDLEDIFPDDPWIENTDVPVQNLEIPEHSVVTAREVLEETILSPDVNVQSTVVEETDHFFSEQFINLATMESNVNSLAADPMAGFEATDNMIMRNFEELLANVKQDVPEFTYEASSQLQNFHVHVSPEPENDLTAAVVPDVMIAENVPSLPESPTDTTNSGVFANDFSLDLNQLDPAIVKLLENLERSEDTTVKPDSKKRPLVEVEEPVDTVPASKKTKSQSCSSEERVPDKIAVRRMKNNEASRVCRASRKARHNDLFDQEKKLTIENKELAAKVKELSATVEYLRNHLVVKLSGRCN
ncbi:uncharacterized protein LOC114529503 [Dendronephthya gigantea]|uniref:uncharacterized protein LOC114529503 n=1 Tax=Dendronephthya gigantea TaxID=151771 RepID=UPI0010691D2A|nr:uncharacterized protein LOC114529503 [Dendronephthya gigantea]